MLGNLVEKPCKSHGCCPPNLRDALERLCAILINAGDWHAYRIASCALYPIVMCWIPNDVEDQAMLMCMPALISRGLIDDPTHPTRRF